MSSDNRFGLLRNVLRAFGLAPEAVDDIVNWIADLLAGKSEAGKTQAPEFPYRLRDHFLSPAELSFYGVLNEAVAGRAVVSSKVGLNDLFQVKTDDQSRYRIYTNKIDRKHVDFLLCDPATMRPLVGIELDDKSHQRADRQARDEFVDQVFGAAKLPIVHISAKRSYAVADLTIQLTPYLGSETTPEPALAPGRVEAPVKLATAGTSTTAPTCPKCGGSMILRTAKSGANAGNQFWGCTNYPICRALLPYKA